jgi:hypothetical protein
MMTGVLDDLGGLLGLRRIALVGLLANDRERADGSATAATAAMLGSVLPMSVPASSSIARTRP